VRVSLEGLAKPPLREHEIQVEASKSNKGRDESETHRSAWLVAHYLSVAAHHLDATFLGMQRDSEGLDPHEPSVKR